MDSGTFLQKRGVNGPGSQTVHYRAGESTAKGICQGSLDRSAIKETLVALRSTGALGKSKEVHYIFTTKEDVYQTQSSF